MATRIISRRDLVGLQSLSFIRPQRVNFQISAAKPSTRLYAFFDGVSIESYLNAPIVTDSAGAASGYFDIPGNTFNTGARQFRVQELSVYDGGALSGSSVGGAQTIFTANGTKQTWQETVTTVNQIIVTIPAPRPPSGGSRDPLAQSFFTYGVTGGCFVTSIELFFATKDSGVPVTVEIREMSNGYPSSTLVSEYATKSLNPASVNTSSTALVGTTFTFSRPIYLRENGEYCFVVLANSNQYNLWTSKFGDKSKETGKTIFEQPYIGSLFKSENNITWTAEQTEDIKFTINKAVFGSGASMTTRARVPARSFMGSWLSVTSGSAVVTATLPFQHAFNTGDKIYLTGSSSGNTYRGISNANLTSASGYTVTVTSDYAFTFTAGAAATSTGSLESTGKLDSIEIENAGSGYTDGTHVLSISAPPSGTTAQASLVISGGKATAINIISPGSGYVSTPTIQLPGIGSGSGLNLIPVSENIMQGAIPLKYQEVAPIIISQVPDSTSLVTTLKSSTQSPRVIGAATEVKNGEFYNIGKDGLLATSTVETDSFGSSSSTELVINLQSDNPNLSPMIDVGNRPRIRTRNYLINGTSNAGSELAAGSGSAQSRYISKKITLATPSKGIRVIANAMSMSGSSFDIFVRTSNSSASTSHESNAWVALTCPVNRDMSTSVTDYRDYEFSLDGLNTFDVYSIKIVLYSTKKYQVPKIANYRAIILAT